MIAPARMAAYRTLIAVSTGRSDLPTAIAAERGKLADERDRALAADIATGVQRWRGQLDHLIASIAKRPIDRLDPEILEVLRLSAYQLLHLTRVPAAAVVDDAVTMARNLRKKSAAGFVNAVLRGLARRRTALPLPPRPSDPFDEVSALDYLSITLSHPRWLAERWYRRMGLGAAEAWMRFDNAPAPLTLRVNTLRTDRDRLVHQLDRDDVIVRPGLYGPDALIVESGQPLAADRTEPGSFMVQDEASQLVPLLAGRAPGARVLDTCASPGGKTTALAAAMGDHGLLVACDVRTKRMALLRKVVDASGAHHVRLVQADLTAPLPFSTLFDTVLVDAPCSGLGTLRRDPDIRWRRVEADLQPLAAAQRQMLDHAAQMVRPGGRLIYATCSSEPEENEQVLSDFQAGHPEFVAVDARRAAPDLPTSVVDARGHLRTEPHRHGLEAFFGAVFERRT